MIEVRGIVKSYGRNLALDDISFTVNKGEIAGLLGPNGAGKSTAMNIITGYLSCDSGSVTIDGIDILKEPSKAKKKLGYLPEQPPLYPDMKVDEYLDFVYELKGCELNREKHIGEVLKVTKTSEVHSRLIRNLSKGYRQRVGFAGALIGDPEVIILDEPTIGLDPKQIIEIRNLIRNLGRRHTVILSTHILSEVQSVCDRILIINEGRIIADEKAENISNAVRKNRRYSLRICAPQREALKLLREFDGIVHAEVTSERELDAFTYYVEFAPERDVRRELFYELANRSWPIIGIQETGVGLEEVFMTLTDEKKKK